jgi:hypothetical protein
MCDRVMSLKLNNCELGHEGMGYILFALENQPNLRLLELENNCKKAEWNNGLHAVSHGLRKIIERCMNLESLSIKNDPDRGYQCELDHFLSALTKGASLLAVDISGNSMSQDNLSALKTVILKNEVLQELHFDDNNITARHIQGFIHAMKQNKALQLVAFPENDYNKEMKKVKGDKKQVLELQMLKKNFYKAMFENNTSTGFMASPVMIRRKAAKRNSFVGEKAPAVEPQQSGFGASLNIPQPDAAW